MAIFGVEEANQLARRRTPGDVAAFIGRFAKRGPLAATAQRPVNLSSAPATAVAAPSVASKPMTQVERDDASVREMLALAAAVGLKGFEQQPAIPPSSGSGGSDEDGAELRRLAVAVGLSGFGGRT